MLHYINFFVDILDMCSHVNPCVIAVGIFGGLIVGTVIQSKLDVKKEKEREIKLKSLLVCLQEKRMRIEEIMKVRG